MSFASDVRVHWYYGEVKFGFVKDASERALSHAHEGRMEGATHGKTGQPPQTKVRRILSYEVKGLREKMV